MNQQKRRLALLCIIILMLIGTAWAQQEQTGRLTALRSSREKLEKDINLEGRSEETRKLFKRTLFSIYDKLQGALAAEILTLKAIQVQADQSEANTREEIGQQIKGLEAERQQTLGKMEKLASDSPTTRLASTFDSSNPSGGPSAESLEINPVPSGGAAALSNSSTQHNRAASVALPAPSVNRTATRTVSPAMAATDPPTVCGQISLASLNSVLAFIRNVLAASQKELKIDKNPEAVKLYLDLANRVGTVNTALLNSRVKDDCTIDDSHAAGDQRKAILDQLRDAARLLALEPNLKAIAGAADTNISKELIEKQVLLLSQYLGGVRVRLQQGDKVWSTMADKDGNYVFEKVTGDTTGDASKSYVVSTEGDDYHTKREFQVAEKNVRVNLEIEDRPVSLLTRAVVGYQQAGAASAKSEQNYFFDLFISKTIPIKQSINPDFGERWRTWGAIRAISIPQSGDATITDTVNNFVANVGGLKTKDAARVFDLLAGIEYRVTGNTALLPSFDRQTKQKFTFSLIAGFGFVTPTDPQEEIKVFKVFKDAPGLPIEAKDKEFVAFIPADRDRFFRQYYAGVRLQTFFFNTHNIPMQRFPAQLDLTFGKNEYVTGGKLDDPVFRIDGYFPLPYENLKFINLFGTAVIRPVRATTGTPLVLQPADASVKPPAANIALIPNAQFNRDYYRIGVGMDFISFVQKLMSLGKK
jgi:Mor family transcriptional regulator